MEYGLGGGEGVEDEATLLKVQDRRRFEMRVLGLDNGRSIIWVVSMRGMTNLHPSLQTLLESSERHRVPVEQDVIELNLDQS